MFFERHVQRNIVVTSSSSPGALELLLSQLGGESMAASFRDGRQRCLASGSNIAITADRRKLISESLAWEALPPAKKVAPQGKYWLAKVADEVRASGLYHGVRTLCSTF